MEEKATNLKFWEVLAQQVTGIPGGKRCLEKLKRGLQEAELAGEEVLCVGEGCS